MHFLADADWLSRAEKQTHSIIYQIKTRTSYLFTVVWTGSLGKTQSERVVLASCCAYQTHSCRFNQLASQKAGRLHWATCWRLAGAVDLSALVFLYLAYKAGYCGYPGLQERNHNVQYKLLPVFVSADEPLAQSSHVIEPRVNAGEGYTGTWIT